MRQLSGVRTVRTLPRPLKRSERTVDARARQRLTFSAPVASAATSATQ
jgi:hypothetical protein